MYFSRLPPFNLYWLKSPEITRLRYIKMTFAPFIFLNSCATVLTCWVYLRRVISGLCFWSFQTVIPPLLHAWLILQIFQIYSCFFKIYQYLIRFEISSIFLSVFVVLKSALLPVLTCWIGGRQPVKFETPTCKIWVNL